MEALGLFGRVERNRMFAHAGRAEIIRQAADRDDERIIADDVPLRDLAAFGIDVGGNLDLLLGTVEADQFADAIAEMMPIGLRQKIHFVHGEIHAAGGHFVQQGLPQMRVGLVDERDLGLAAAAERVAEARDQLEATGTAADDNDAMQLSARLSHAILPQQKVTTFCAGFLARTKILWAPGMR